MAGELGSDLGRAQGGPREASPTFLSKPGMPSFPGNFYIEFTGSGTTGEFRGFEKKLSGLKPRTQRKS